LKRAPCNKQGRGPDLNIEEHGPVRSRPREVDLWLEPFCNCDSIL
jgi:hypothetical protein